jgi:hypothetical protein
MRAILRVGPLLLAGCILLLAAPAVAQTTTAPATQNTPAASTPTTNAPATDAIGPRELQNFSLPGTSARPAEQQQPPVAITPAPATQPTGKASGEARRVAAEGQAARLSAKPPSAAAVPPTQAPAVSVAEQSALPPAPQPTIASPAPANTPRSPAEDAPEHRISFFPWLIAGLLLSAGTIFFLWRRRPRQSLAGAGEFDLFAAPEPEPEAAAAPGLRWMPPPAAAEPPAAPARAATPPKPAHDPAGGIVATRLRPSLEIGVRPLRCLVEDSQVTLEFELDLFNAGTAPARAILAEASLLNAGATQDQELAAFFSRPAPAGDPLEAIAPMKRMTMTSRVIAPRGAIQEYDLGGRKSFVPLIAFNALYEWSSGKGQTSAAYLVGRETNGEKLGPLRLDSGAREVRGLGARTLPVGVRA